MVCRSLCGRGGWSPGSSRRGSSSAWSSSSLAPGRAQGLREPGSQPAESLAYMNRCWTHQFLSPIARHVKSLPRIYRM
jgi:hypothetical protein